MRENFMRLIKGKVFLGVLLFALLAAAAAVVGTTLLRENNVQENEQLNLQETDNQYEHIVQNTEPAKLETMEAETAELAKLETEAVETEEIPEIPTDVFVAIEDDSLQEVAVDPGEIVAALPVLNFTLDSKLDWPIHGNVVLDYSMDSTIYFPTLNQYKTNPAVLIQGSISEPVLATVEGIVAAVGQNEEIGNYLVLDLGNNFQATYGQLKDIPVITGDHVSEGQVLGYIAEPTKYYVVEGTNLYFKITEDGVPVDPLDFIQ